MIHRYAYQYQKVIQRDLQSMFLTRNSMNLPKLKSIDAQISIRESSHILPALSALELITGQKAKVNISNAIGTKGQVASVSTKLRKRNMYDFLDILVNIYVPAMKRADVLKRAAIAKELEMLNFEHILTKGSSTQFTLESIGYLLPIEREFEIFGAKQVSDTLSLQVSINCSNEIDGRAKRRSLRES
eukprot:snap_masked-scaffold_7-processed-gene-10.33-mRNA-1 protein AED:1.00 eAED:1.00 QI:0/-1/0/0/-1/1/1/0/186